MRTLFLLYLICLPGSISFIIRRGNTDHERNIQEDLEAHPRSKRAIFASGFRILLVNVGKEICKRALVAIVDLSRSLVARMVPRAIEQEIGQEVAQEAAVIEEEAFVPQESAVNGRVNDQLDEVNVNLDDINDNVGNYNLDAVNDNIGNYNLDAVNDNLGNYNLDNVNEGGNYNLDPVHKIETGIDDQIFTYNEISSSDPEIVNLPHSSRSKFYRDELKI